MTDTYRIRNISFGDLEKDDIHDILKDGRLASHFLERQLEVWYPHLIFVDGRGHCKNITYICCDIIEFPMVRVRFVKGSDLMKDYPKFKIPPKDREVFFS